MRNKIDASAKLKKDDDYEIDPEEQKRNQELLALKEEKIKKEKEERAMQAEDRKMQRAAAEAH